MRNIKFEKNQFYPKDSIETIFGNRQISNHFTLINENNFFQFTTKNFVDFYICLKKITVKIEFFSYDD